MSAGSANKAPDTGVIGQSLLQKLKGKAGIKLGKGVKFVPKNPGGKPVKYVHKNLHDDFFDAAGALDQMIVKLADEKMDKPVLFVTTPGIGKTQGGVHLACVLSKDKRKPFYAVTSRNMAWQCYERIKGGFYGFGHHVIMLEGRHNGYVRRRLDNNGFIEEIKVAPNCHQYDKVCKAREKGYPSQHYVCAGCPFYPHYKDQDGDKTGYQGACGYFKTLYQAAGFVPVGDGKWAPIVVTTHHMMGNIITDSEMMKPEFVIIDEDPVTALRETYDWNQQEISRKIDGLPLIRLRELLVKTTEVAEKYLKLSNVKLGWEADKEKKKPMGAELIKGLDESKVFGSSILWGQKLALVLKKAADELKIDLVQVLTEASEADNGVDKGEYMSMPAWRFERLPHHKEPELAGELLNIVLTAHEKQEVAYKVSLRWNPEDGWGWVWDQVRRITYGGPLVFLDAYGEPTITERVCSREVDVREVHCKVRSNLTVRRYPAIRTSRAVMDKQRDQIFDEYVEPELRRLKGKKVLLYTQKRYADWLEERIKKGNYNFAAHIIKWFWMDRGDDSYGDFDAMVVFGSPFSNVVAEMNFANALFFGEDPLNFDTDKKHVPVDDRVRVHKEARQEKELLQALFRLRPSKPREAPQDIVIFSAMEVPVKLEFPGANWETFDDPNVDFNSVHSSIHRVYKRYGCWVNTFAAFASNEDPLIEWIDAGASESDKEFPYSYDELVHRIKVVRKQSVYGHVVNVYFNALGIEPQRIAYNGREVLVWGDEKKAVELLDHIKNSTREPGCDEEELIEEPIETTVGKPDGNAIVSVDIETAQSSTVTQGDLADVIDINDYANALAQAGQYPDAVTDFDAEHYWEDESGGSDPPDDEE